VFILGQAVRRMRWRDSDSLELSGREVVVVGLGVSGTWCARWLARLGARVIVSEIKPRGQLDPSLLAELSTLGVTLETEGHRKETFTGADLIVVSPGVDHREEMVCAARNEGIPILGEMELASRWIRSPIVAVTGTNGKSTVTSLIGALIERAGFKVFVGGNIGTPLMAYVAQGVRSDYVVAEVSSFQLDTTTRFSPHVALILNISPDHLDRYPDYEAYVQSKMRIFENQTAGQYLILNDDDKQLASVPPRGQVSVLRYGKEKTARRQAYMDGEVIKTRVGGMAGPAFSTRSFSLPGVHNLENLMAAILAGLALHLDPVVIQQTIDQFRGLPNRIEYLGMLRGVSFYNDSKATNVDSAVVAVKSFKRNIVLIAGGRHKGADYGPLVEASRGKVTHCVFLGEAKDLLLESFRDAARCTVADSLEEAVAKAYQAASPGDVVLLAPACSSFDMFSDYAHRGRIFKAAVKVLSESANPEGTALNSIEGRR
jgi:UDP-N-acetylmuramoylalanine--D-glutamate ligase